MAVGSKVYCAAFAALSCFEYARQIFGGDGDGRVGFIVFEQYVVVRFVTLDEVVLKQQGVGLRLYHHIAYVAYVCDEQSGFARLLLFVEV